MTNGEGPLEFAVCIFDCSDLKRVNDQNGLDKEDLCLKETVEIICEVFHHSPVFRIGGEEFAAVLLNSDYQNREELLRIFDEKCLAMRSGEAEIWNQVDVARAMAVYDPSKDISISDVIRRAEKLTAENSK